MQNSEITAGESRAQHNSEPPRIRTVTISDGAPLRKSVNRQDDSSPGVLLHPMQARHQGAPRPETTAVIRPISTSTSQPEHEVT
jgi:hypothetical protein